MTKKRILIVDDEPHIVELVKISLESESFEVFEAHDGKEGLKLAKDVLPDLVLLDIAMPKMDGYELCHKLKSTEKTHNIQILVLTSKNRPVDQEKVRECGADAFLTKPFSPLKLLAVVKEQLRQ